MCKHQHGLGLEVQFSTLVDKLHNIFSNRHLYQAGQSMDSLPAQMLERWAKVFGSNQYCNAFLTLRHNV